MNVVTLHFGCSGRLEGGPACSPGCARCSVGRRSRSSSPGGVQRGEYPSVFQEMAEQRGYFVASEWAQGGCTTLYQLPEEGKTVLLLLNNFHSCFFPSSYQSYCGTSRSFGTSVRASRTILFDSEVALDAHKARGSRFGVRTQRPSPLMVCIMFGLRFSARLNANTAVKWIIHSSSESIS